MPGFFDRDPRSTWADSFDNSAAASLYWKQIPVILRLCDREEHGCDLTVRIFSGTGHGSHAYRVGGPAEETASFAVREPRRPALLHPKHRGGYNTANVGHGISKGAAVIKPNHGVCEC